MYPELEKYKTGKKINVTGVLPNGSEVPLEMDEYAYGLGDMINDFIDHKKKPWWKRHYHHKHLTKLYIKMLNKIEMKHGF